MEESGWPNGTSEDAADGESVDVELPRETDDVDEDVDVCLRFRVISPPPNSISVSIMSASEAYSDGEKATGSKAAGDTGPDKGRPTEVREDADEEGNDAEACGGQE